MSRPAMRADMAFQFREALIMTSVMTVSQLSDEQLGESYALIRTLAPEISRAQWLRYARRAADKGGVLGALGEGGAIFGLLTWRREDCLRYGSVLLVENFVTFELSRAAPARKALCETVDAIAKEQGCSAVRLIVAGRGIVDPASNKALGWTSLGHDPDEVILTRKTDCCCGDPEYQAKAEAFLPA